MGILQNLLRFFSVIIIGAITSMIYYKIKGKKFNNKLFIGVSISLGFVGSVLGQYLFQEIIHLNRVINFLQEIPFLDINIILCVLGALIILWIFDRLAPDASRDIK